MRLTDTLTDHSLIESVRFYYDDHTYHRLEQFNTNAQRLFVPLSEVSSPWLEYFNAEGWSKFFFFQKVPCLKKRQMKMVL